MAIFANRTGQTMAGGHARSRSRGRCCAGLVLTGSPFNDIPALADSPALAAAAPAAAAGLLAALLLSCP